MCTEREELLRQAAGFDAKQLELSISLTAKLPIVQAYVRQNNPYWQQRKKN